MRRSGLFVAGLVLAGVWAVRDPPLRAARAPAGERQAPPRVVPVEQEPRHRPVFENRFVIVLDVQLPSGYVSLFHTHSLDNVSVRIATDMIRIDRQDADGTPQLTPIGAIGWNPATPPYTHRVANVGQGPIRILDVEILDRLPAQTSAVVDALAGHAVVVENARLRATRITLGAGAALAPHSHPKGWLEIVVRGTDPGRYTWHSAGAAAPRIAAGAAPIEIVELEPR